MLRARCPPALQPPCQYFSTASTPPILCSLQTLNPAPSHQGIAYTPRPTPPKNKPLGIHSPPANPSGCVGSAVGWGCRSWEGAAVPQPLACLLPPPLPPLRRSEITAVPEPPPRRGRPSVGTAGAGAAAPPLLCKICPLHILSPTGTVSDSPSAPTTPAHLCAGRGLSDPFLPALKSLPPAGCPCCHFQGYR